MSYLKNCPFCGSEAEEIRPKKKGATYRSVVRCSSIKCVRTLQRTEAWNTRAEPTEAMIDDMAAAYITGKPLRLAPHEMARRMAKAMINAMESSDEG